MYVGFVGEVIYVAHDASGRQRRELDALAMLSGYCGTGANTTSGMGVTEYLRMERQIQPSPAKPGFGAEAPRTGARSAVSALG